jgi:hypothetical protein
MSRSSPIYSPYLIRHHTRRILLAIALAAIAILSIGVILIVPCLIRQSPFVSDSQSDATYVKNSIIGEMTVAMDVTLGPCAG